MYRSQGLWEDDRIPISQNGFHFSLFHRTRLAAGCSLTRRVLELKAIFWRSNCHTRYILEVILVWVKATVSYFNSTIVIKHIHTHAITKSITEEINFYNWFSYNSCLSNITLKDRRISVICLLNLFQLWRANANGGHN